MTDVRPDESEFVAWAEDELRRADPNIVAPYRLEWRPYGSSRWQVIDCLHELPVGPGQWRIVSQPRGVTEG